MNVFVLVQHHIVGCLQDFKPLEAILSDIAAQHVSPGICEILCYEHRVGYDDRILTTAEEEGYEETKFGIYEHRVYQVELAYQAAKIENQ